MTRDNKMESSSATFFARELTVPQRHASVTLEPAMTTKGRRRGASKLADHQVKLESPSASGSPRLHKTFTLVPSLLERKTKMRSLGFPVLDDPEQPQVHGSTLLLVGTTLYVAWFGGSYEGAPDTKIWLSTTSIGRDRQPTEPWSAPRVLASQSRLPHWNPVLFKVPNHQRITLYYKVGATPARWFTRVIESTNKGRTWSQTRELVRGDEGGRGPDKNKLLVLGGSETLAPFSLATRNGSWKAFVDRSPDAGITWMRSLYVPVDESWPEDGPLQPCLVRHSEDIVSMFCRSATGYVARSDSGDRGRTWGALYPTDLLNSNSGIDAIALDSGIWLMVHNPVGMNWGPRTPLVISSSADQGETWEQLLCLEDKPPSVDFEPLVGVDSGTPTHGESEFSSPAIIHDGKGGVYVSYTYERVGIKVVHIEADEIS